MPKQPDRTPSAATVPPLTLIQEFETAVIACEEAKGIEANRAAYFKYIEARDALLEAMPRV